MEIIVFSSQQPATPFDPPRLSRYSAIGGTAARAAERACGAGCKWRQLGLPMLVRSVYEYMTHRTPKDGIFTNIWLIFFW